MENTAHDHKTRHLAITESSPWIRRFAPLVPPGARVLDLACGGGRHGRLFLDRGALVTFIDKTTAPVADLGENPNAHIIEADLETGAPVFSGSGPLAKQTFDAIVVSNYLYRPHLAPLISALAPGGVLIYETFALGNEAFNRPRNPDHLLKSGELLTLVHGKLHVVAYEHGLIETGPLPGVKQRITATNTLANTPRTDGEPEPQPLNPS